MSKPIIFTDNIEITYNLGQVNEFKANKGTSVAIFPQEYIILFGPSGCGKSTLLYSMFGVLPPSKGKVYVKGESIYDYSSMQMVQFQRKTMGIMYQQFNLIPSISVLDNVALPLIFAGVPPSIRDRRARELLKRFAIDHVAHKLPTNLSGGQQQRVSAARSLVNDPEILIADEPVGNLDSISAEQVMQTLETINMRDKKTVLLVTHDAKYLPYAHRVVHLKDGRLERIVANPEKKQIKKIIPGETIVTEIEQIARLSPYSSPAELRVKSIVNYLTQVEDFEQITFLEKAIEAVINGRMSETMLYDRLRAGDDKAMPFTEEEAHRMSEKLVRMMRQARDITKLRTLKQKGVPVSPRDEKIIGLTKYILEECDVKAEGEQFDQFCRRVAERVAGLIRKEELNNVLQLPREEDGVGFDPYTAHILTRYYEKLIAQGVVHIGQHGAGH
jgi:putative ABC transport system ATP-binding protein